jgi:hypothetical protein
MMINIEPKFVPGTTELYFANFFHMDYNIEQGQYPVWFSRQRISETM